MAGESLDLFGGDTEFAEDARGQAFLPAHEGKEIDEFIDSPAAASANFIGERARETYHVVTEDDVAGGAVWQGSLDHILDQADIDGEGAELEEAEACESPEENEEMEIHGDLVGTEAEGLLRAFKAELFEESVV